MHHAKIWGILSDRMGLVLDPFLRLIEISDLNVRSSLFLSLSALRKQLRKAVNVWIGKTVAGELSLSIRDAWKGRWHQQECKKSENEDKPPSGFEGG